MTLRPNEDNGMNRVFLAAALAGASFTGAAVIGPTAAQTAPAPKGDADGDGVLTRDEAMAQADARFDRMDVNKDGKLSADEMRPRGPMGGPGMPPPPPPGTEGAPPPPPPPGGPGMGGRGAGGRMLARIDTNGDGEIDREEFRAQAARRFDRMDTNKDGKIDAAERQAARDAMERMRGRRGNGGDMPPPPPNAPADKPGQ
jgi:hypothetical protein